MLLLQNEAFDILFPEIVPEVLRFSPVFSLRLSDSLDRFFVSFLLQVFWVLSN